VKITLNLATRPYADQGPALKRLRIGMAALAVVLIGLVFGLLHDSAHYTRRWKMTRVFQASIQPET